MEDVSWSNRAKFQDMLGRSPIHPMVLAAKIKASNAMGRRGRDPYGLGPAPPAARGGEGGGFRGKKNDGDSEEDKYSLMAMALRRALVAATCGSSKVPPSLSSPEAIAWAWAVLIAQEGPDKRKSALAMEAAFKRVLAKGEIRTGGGYSGSSGAGIR